MHHSAYSSHYAQAYSQYYYPVNNSPLLSSPAPIRYQHGPCRCFYRGCSFAGSQKALEIHRMDRHLIYPPGWDKHKKASDWDADPSLKGKPIRILGTNLNLDKPGDLDTWLSERRNKWPTKLRVEEKKRKLGEAIARGRLPETLTFRDNKKPRTTQRDRMNYHNAGRGPRRGKLSQRASAASRIASQQSIAHSEVGLVETTMTSLASSIKSSDNDDVPEIISSKEPQLPSTRPKYFTEATQEEHIGTSVRKLNKPPPQPKNGAHNPFASRPPLLLNLLLPEIRVTISNLSQAIKFLVDNDFLEGVESTPGAATSGMIQVINALCN